MGVGIGPYGSGKRGEGKGEVRIVGKLKEKRGNRSGEDEVMKSSVGQVGERRSCS